MHIKTSNDNELTQAMAEAIQRVGEGCTKADLREWFTAGEIRRCGDAAISRAHDMRVREARASDPAIKYPYYTTPELARAATAPRLSTDERIRMLDEIQRRDAVAAA
jgi:hypothetical protein